MKTILISNIKGGTGKSTTSINLACILARESKVLVIDADVQKNTTYALGGETEGVGTLYDILVADPKIELNKVIQKTQWENLDIIASDDLLSEAVISMQADTIKGLFAMKNIITRVTKERDYDYVVIDTNPQADIILRACMICADEMIIPVLADMWSLMGISRLSEEVSAVHEQLNPTLRVSGILLCNYEKSTNMGKDMGANYKEIAEAVGTDFFETRISKSVKVSEAITKHRLPVVAWKPSCTVSLDYDKWVKELKAKEII